MKDGETTVPKIHPQILNREIFQLLIKLVIAGGAGRSALRPARHVDRRGVALLADAETSTASPVQADPRPPGFAGPRHTALGGQLRPPVRLHLRFPGGVRVDAVHLVRPLRPPTQDLDDLDLPDPDRRSVHPAPSPVLQRAGVRVRGVQAVQLHPVHARLLRLAEHQLQTGGARMTHGAVFRNPVRTIIPRDSWSNKAGARLRPFDRVGSVGMLFKPVCRNRRHHHHHHHHRRGSKETRTNAIHDWTNASLFRADDSMRRLEEEVSRNRGETLVQDERHCLKVK